MYYVLVTTSTSGSSSTTGAFFFYLFDIVDSSYHKIVTLSHFQLSDKLGDNNVQCVISSMFNMMKLANWNNYVQS